MDILQVVFYEHEVQVSEIIAVLNLFPFILEAA
jgi:hypothetical protein